MKKNDVELIRVGTIKAVAELQGSITADVARIGCICPTIEFYKNAPLVSLERQRAIQTIELCRQCGIVPHIVYYDGPIDETKFLIITREDVYPLYDGVALGWYIYD